MSTGEHRWSVTANEERAAALVRDWLESNQARIRILCPRGHFIADVELSANPFNIWTYPRDSSGEYGPLLHDANHGYRLAWDHPSQSTNVSLTCRNERCAYRGQHNQFKLAVELGISVMAGHAEHRMID